MFSFAPWLCVLASVWALPSLAGPHHRDNAAQRYLVESADSAPSDAPSLLAGIERELAERGLVCRASLHHALSSPIFRGASFALDCDEGRHVSPSLVRELSMVRGAWVDSVVEHGGDSAPPARASPNEPELKRHLHASRGSRETAPPPVAPRDSSEVNPLGVDIFKLVHESSGVSRLTAARRSGSSARVGVLDTAFDLTAPALAETNIRYAKDLQRGLEGREHVGSRDSVTCNADMHGTTTLGTLAGKGDTTFGYVGVAPDAEVEVYAIDTGCGEVYVSDQVKYYTEVSERHLHVLTQPYGKAPSFPDALWNLLVDRMQDSGTVVVTSAGNGGPGPFTAGGPTSDIGGLHVGCYDEAVIPRYGWLGRWTAGPETGTFRYAPTDQPQFPTGKPLTVWWPWPVDDFNPTDPLPGPQSYGLRGKSLGSIAAPATGQVKPPANAKDTILLFSRFATNVIDPADGEDLAENYNIPYEMRYTESGPVQAYNGPRAGGVLVLPPAVGSMSVAEEVAKNLIWLIKKYGSVQVTVTSDPGLADAALYSAEPNPKTALVPSYWSAWGPTLAGRMGPALLGPGNFLFSPYPKRLGGFGVWRGTSFATPYVAGVAALVKDARPTWTAKQIRDMMVATAVPVRYNTGHPKFETKPFLAPLISQGGGKVDAWAAVHAKALVNVKALDFNDTLFRARSLDFVLTNVASAATSFRLSHRPAASVYLLNKTTLYEWVLPELEEEAVLPAYAEISISPKSVRLEPGDSATITVRIRKDPVAPDAAKRFLAFGGYVGIEDQATPQDAPLTIPYSGIHGRMFDIPGIVAAGTYTIVYNLTDQGFKAMGEPGRVFTALYTASAGFYPITFADAGVPGFYMNYIMPSRDFSWSVVNVQTGEVVLADVPGNYDDSPEGTFGSKQNAVQYLNLTAQTPFLRAGRYRFDAKALRNYGTPGTPHHYDRWSSREWVLEWADNTTNVGPRAVAAPASASDGAQAASKASRSLDHDAF